MMNNTAKDAAAALALELHGMKGRDEIHRLLRVHGGNWNLVWASLQQQRADQDKEDGYDRF